MNVFSEIINDREFISKLIPQKPPFVMVDSLLAYADKMCTAGLTISDENILATKTHLSAAGLIEHMAQSAALYTGYRYHLLQEKPPVGYIGAVNKVEIQSLPKIGQNVITKVVILHEIMNITIVSLKTYCNDTLMASGELKIVLLS